MLVAESHGIAGGVLAYREGRAVKIQMCGVALGHRGRGLSRRLMEALEAAAPRSGATTIYLGGASEDEKDTLISKPLPPSVAELRRRVVRRSPAQ